MTTSYFSITSNESVPPEKIGDLLIEKFGENAHGICITEIPKATKQQPSIPVQFVWYNSKLYPLVEFCITTSYIENCTVEQIGAVLYVRAK